MADGKVAMVVEEVVAEQPGWLIKLERLDVCQIETVGQDSAVD